MPAKAYKPVLADLEDCTVFEKNILSRSAF